MAELSPACPFVNPDYRSASEQIRDGVQRRIRCRSRFLQTDRRSEHGCIGREHVEIDVHGFASFLGQGQ